jgi:hypothetical protein
VLREERRSRSGAPAPKIAAPYTGRVVSQDPVTRLRKIALDLERMADELERETQLDPTMFRYLRTQLLDIAAEIERHGAAA